MWLPSLTTISKGLPMAVLEEALGKRGQTLSVVGNQSKCHALCRKFRYLPVCREWRQEHQDNCRKELPVSRDRKNLRENEGIHVLTQLSVYRVKEKRRKARKSSYSPC